MFRYIVAFEFYTDDAAVSLFSKYFFLCLVNRNCSGTAPKIRYRKEWARGSHYKGRCRLSIEREATTESCSKPSPRGCGRGEGFPVLDPFHRPRHPRACLAARWWRLQRRAGGPLLPLMSRGQWYHRWGGRLGSLPRRSLESGFLCQAGITRNKTWANLVLRFKYSAPAPHFAEGLIIFFLL